MSFRCSDCNEPQPPRVTPIKYIEEIRDKVYFDENGEFINKGYEIKKELRLCKKCGDMREDDL